MDSGHSAPSVLAGQSSQPRVQGQSPPLVGSEQADNGGHLQRDSTEMPLIGSSTGHSLPRDRNYPHPDLEPTLQIPAATRGRDGHMIVSQRITMGHAPSTYGLDHVVPVVEKHHLGTLGARLHPTIKSAEAKKTQYEIRAKWTSYALNIAIGLQVLLGALTTGLSASLSSNQIKVAIPLLGGLSTIVASYLARARGSNEPELSITRVKDLDKFLRKCKAFEGDHGHEYGPHGSELDEELCALRREFEELLGNGDGQRKLDFSVQSSNTPPQSGNTPPVPPHSSNYV
ncbi:hypothetical protein K503DRAFT_802519 [Rhizopogon vinicolor AM-OR11-026]|uniref:SMODS and SLOG-associating 2TM effector domain-containing protein n=1 Tax=Rhizopogon vinicolor AM-OR11-026 TaxID=1314800 RepID=A0A1B7MTA4_9AGAM|nr:hypothetical protein K503DRAFT_802519 [Rhizopogon vinicolor AM-OR11-026]